MRYTMIVYVLAWSFFADAGVMYHWKDEAGQTHFTDNLNLVPDQYRDDSERKLPDYTGQLETESRGLKLDWQNRCASCHYVDEQRKSEGLVSLSPLLVNNHNGRLNESQLVIIGVEHVLDNSGSQQVKTKLSQEEIVIL